MGPVRFEKMEFYFAAETETENENGKFLSLPLSQWVGYFQQQLSGLSTERQGML